MYVVSLFKILFNYSVSTFDLIRVSQQKLNYDLHSCLFITPSQIYFMQFHISTALTRSFNILN